MTNTIDHTKKAFTIIHRDQRGEAHEIHGPWFAYSAEHALEEMLLAAREGDDGHYEVFAT